MQGTVEVFDQKLSPTNVSQAVGCPEVAVGLRCCWSSALPVCSPVLEWAVMVCSVASSGPRPQSLDYWQRVEVPSPDCRPAARGEFLEARAAGDRASVAVAERK